MESELKLVESREEREKHITKDYVLEKVKALILLPDNTHVTTEMVANYYEVTEEVIRQLIVRNNDELLSDGLKVLTGKELSDIKSLCQIQSRARSLTIIPRRAVLRIGMLLRDSEIAKQVRTYLLNLEENTDISSKVLALVSDNTNKINIIDEKLLRIERIVGSLEATTEEGRHLANIIINKVDELLGQPLFRINENMNNAYDNLVLIEFANALNLCGNAQYKYKIFNDAFANWTGENNDRVINKKQNYIYKYGIDVIKQFVFGVKQGIIKKNSYGNWVSLSGIYSNKVEWQKLLNEFNHECAYCGSNETASILMADHVKPQSTEGSTDIYYNLVPCCSDCNKSKMNLKTGDWYQKQEFCTDERIDKISNHIKEYFIKKSCESISSHN